MKTLIIIVVALAAGYFIGCSGNPKNQLSSVSSQADTVNSLNFERRSSADSWVQNYKSVWQNIIKDSKLVNSMPRYFTIKSQDVLNAMGIDSSWKYITKLRYMRLTLGYDTLDHTVKAFIQPVVNVDFKKNSAGTALFFNIRGQIVDSQGKKVDSLNKPYPAKGFKLAKTKLKSTTTDTVYVADLSTPCPNTCGN